LHAEELAGDLETKIEPAVLNDGAKDRNAEPGSGCGYLSLGDRSLPVAIHSKRMFAQGTDGLLAELGAPRVRRETLQHGSTPAYYRLAVGEQQVVEVELQQVPRSTVSLFTLLRLIHQKVGHEGQLPVPDDDRVGEAQQAFAAGMMWRTVQPGG